MRFRVVTWVAVLTALTLLLTPDPASATVDPTSTQSQVLAERYAPIVMLKAQADRCDADGEPFAPMSVDSVLSNDDVLLRQAGVGDPVVTRAPTAADLYGRGEGFFLDFNGLALDPGCVYEHDFRSNSEGSSPVVYAHVVQQADKPDQLAIQYWLYWYFNDWNNTHESDWEFIQILFDASTVAEALESEPVAVGYAQHEGGETAAWSSEKLQKRGSQPVVYSSAGSHASYFSQSVSLGRQGTEGFGCDTTAGPSVRINPEVVLLPDTAAAGDEFEWLTFTGRWGERHSGPFNGPTGPITKPRWLLPVDWHDGLRAASVEIPGGDDGSGTILDTFCNVVDSGSNQLRAAQRSPAAAVVVLSVAALALFALARRTEWSNVPPVPLRRRRRTGQMIRAALTTYSTSMGALRGVALAYVPAALIVGLVGALATFTAGQFVAGLLTSLMFAIATATISAFWHLGGTGSETGAGSAGLGPALKLVQRRTPALVVTSLRAFAIVSGLSLTGIGLPWAIRQAVRYQFAIPVAVTENLGGARALARSSELVRGRWWRTALTVGLFSLLAFLVNAAVQLGLLILLSGVPLWLYSAVSFLGIGLVVPMVATPAILLYGDAVARTPTATPGAAPTTAAPTAPSLP
ncbi:MAG: hypothetical protein WBA45_00995 [Microthrixaceae bacterium]